MSDEPTVTKHEPRWRGTGYGGGRMVCRCGDDCEDGYATHVEPFAVERIAQARREAWDQGMRTGSSRAMRRMSDEPSLPLASEADNPYRGDA